VDLLLLDEEGRASEVRLRWRSARLARELGLGGASEGGKANLSRNTRLGRQASGDFPSGSLDRATPASVLASRGDNLNARLQADRGALVALARLEKKAPRRAADRLRHVNWFVTTSPELEPSGPWLDFVQIPSIGKIIDSKTDSPVWKPSRRNPRWDVRHDMGWMVRPGLGVFPGIRVLGVDLGHRYGAIGAVWQQVSATEVRDAARSAGVSVPSGEGTISFRCEDRTRPKAKKGKRKGEYPELLFRRVGKEQWVRLERQFLIRLPGEKDGDSRALLDWELEWLPDFLKALDGVPEEAAEVLKEDAATARLETAHLCVRALRRHGDRARIIHYLTADKLPAPGGKLVEVKQRLPYAQKAVQLWDRLSGRSAENPERQALGALASGLDRAEGAERQKLLDQIAERLSADVRAAGRIAQVFEEAWKAEDTLWLRRLRDLSAWLVRGRKREKGAGWVLDHGARARVGGLSLERISAFEQIARLQRAFAHRPTPERLHHDEEETVPHGRSVRDKMERLREDRLKKLANAVAMSALGLVAKHADKARRVERDRHVGERFQPVHAVVIEDLEFYRPEVSRTRRENRGLMSWSARELAKRLGDACALHGLLLLQVRPNYTSRFCSRCGAPGARGHRLKPSQLAHDWYWSRQTAKAKTAKPEERTALHRRLLELDAAPASKKEVEVFLPRQGGPLFCCSNKDCRVQCGLQADLNAAANIGLRALLDGRWEYGWAYLPTRAGKPIGEKALLGMPSSLSKTLLSESSTADAKHPVNLFRDPALSASITASRWKVHKEFFREVESRILAAI